MAIRPTPAPTADAPTAGDPAAGDPAETTATTTAPHDVAPGSDVPPPAPRRAPLYLLGWAAMIALVALMPRWLPATGFLTVTDGIFAAFFTMVAIGLVLLMGYAGQTSLGQNAMYGLGAYGSAILTAKQGWNPWLAMVASAVIAALVALVIGIPTFRLRGHFLALATLGLGVIASIIFNNAPIGGGANGLSGIPPLQAFGTTLTTDTQFIYLGWGAALLVLLLARNLVTSRTGRALRAVQGSEAAAEAAGIRTIRFKVMVFMVSAVFASLAGSLFAHYSGFLSPSPFRILVSVELLVMAVVGGLRSVWGAPFGALAVVALNSLLDKYIPQLIPSASGDFQIIGFGIVLVVFLNFLPNGLADAARRLTAPVFDRRPSASS